MKATLTFNLDDAEDSMAHLRAIQSTNMALVLWELVHNSKRTFEHEIQGKNLDGYEVLDLIFEKLYEELDSHGLNIDKLIY